MSRRFGASRQLALVPVTVDNWRAVDAVQPRPEQERFVAPISRYLCLMLFDGVWTCLAVETDGDEIVARRPLP